MDAGSTNEATGLMSDTRMITILVVNGATLLIVVVLMIRVLAKVLERLFSGFTLTITQVKDELAGLRTDVRDIGTRTAVAVGHLTERVSRIEGKIEGIAGMAGMSDRADEVTGVTSRVPPEDHAFREDPTPVLTPIPRPPTIPRTPTPRVPTPPAGVPRHPGAGSYGPSRPKTRG